MDFPNGLWSVKQLLSTFDPEVMHGASSAGGGVGYSINGVTSGAGITTPVYVPFFAGVPAIIKKFFFVNGNTIAGNLDIAVYDEGGLKLGGTGSVAQAGSYAFQLFDTTDFLIGRGRYYIGVVMSTAVGNTMAANIAATYGEMGGYAIEAGGAMFPLPSVATFAAFTTTRVPLCGFTTVVTA